MSAPKTWRLTAVPLDGDGETGDLIADQAGPLLAVFVQAGEQIGAWAENVVFEGKREGGDPAGLAGVDITLEPVDLDEPLGRIEELAELRCPACCSPEVGDCRDSSLSGWLQCGNCAERFERDSALVSVGDAEAYSTRPKLGLKVLTHGDERFLDFFGTEAEVVPLD
jgi:hypothetical protein